MTVTKIGDFAVVVIAYAYEGRIVRKLIDAAEAVKIVQALDEKIYKLESGAVEFDTELWTGIKKLLNEWHYDWSGETEIAADEVIQYLRDCITSINIESEKQAHYRAVATVADQMQELHNENVKLQTEVAKWHASYIVANNERLAGAGNYAAALRLLNSIQDALATGEVGENLVGVARDTHQRELELAAIYRKRDELGLAGTPLELISQIGELLWPDPLDNLKLTDLDTSLRVRSIGDHVTKPSGYKFPGTIRGVFFTIAGKLRYVVERDDSDGELHIFSPEQIAAKPDRPLNPQS